MQRADGIILKIYERGVPGWAGHHRRFDGAKDLECPSSGNPWLTTFVQSQWRGDNISLMKPLNLVCLALFMLFGCAHNATGQRDKMSKSPKEEVEQLMNALIPFAQQMLAKHGEFYPYGGAITTAGKIVMVGATETDDHPDSQKVIDGLNEGFRSKAKAGEYSSTGLVFDVKVKPPKSDQKTDAIQINLDHATGLSLQVFLPYQIGGKGDVSYGEMFAQQGDAKVFKQ
jgi:hypothetical protein